MDQSRLIDFVWEILGARIVPRPAAETWDQLVARIRSGSLVQIDRGTYTHFLEAVPPRYVGPSFYAFAAGAEPIQLFLHRHNRFFARQLTDEETQQFCTLAGIPCRNERRSSMIVDPSDGSCRECGGVLEIIDADDVTLSVQCLSCQDEYLVETDAFGDGGLHYQLGFLQERQGKEEP